MKVTIQATTECHQLAECIASASTPPNAHKSLQGATEEAHGVTRQREARTPAC